MIFSGRAAQGAVSGGKVMRGGGRRGQGRHVSARRHAKLPLNISPAW